MFGAVPEDPLELVERTGEAMYVLRYQAELTAEEIVAALVRVAGK